MAEEYERVRSGYPAALVDRALELGGLQPGDPVVEIGPGTGKLTRELAGRELVVDAVEPDDELSRVARRIVADAPVRFHAATFEDVELPEGAFRAAFAATSYHWIDPDVGWRKVASLLEPGGMLALVSHVGGKRGELDEEITAVWQAVTGSTWKPLDDDVLWAGVETRKGNVSELWSWLSQHDLARPEAASLFRDVQLVREPVERELPVEDYLALVRTTNHYLHLDSGNRRRLEEGLADAFGRHGGVHPGRSDAVLVTARRA